MDVHEPEHADSHASTDLEVLNPTMDLEQYQTGYTGLAKLQRLKFVSDHCPVLRAEALGYLIQYLRDHTHNTTMYQRVYCDIQGQNLAIAPPPQDSNPPTNGPDVASSENGAGGDPRPRIPAFDPVWVEQTTKKAALKVEKLDQDLKHYKSNSIRESIRRGLDDLGEHYLEMGDLTQALKCFSRSRDYCSVNKHTYSMCFNVIKVSSASAQGGGSGQSSGSSRDPTSAQWASKLKCAAGLAELANRKYKQAARNFLQISFDHFNYPELVSPNNVAVYGSLCALASFDRQELGKNVIGNTGFKQFLELEPQMTDILVRFYQSQYAGCLTLLDEVKDNLLLDLYLSSHVNALYAMIRNRGLIQYFSPYLSARLDTMAQAFKTTVHALEDELTELILDGQVKGRIDSHNKILFAKDVDQRTSVFEAVLRTGETFERRSRILKVRVAMHKAQIHVKAPSNTTIQEPQQPSSNEAQVATPDNSAGSSPKQ